MKNSRTPSPPSVPYRHRLLEEGSRLPEVARCDPNAFTPRCFTIQRPGDAIESTDTACGIGSGSTGTRADLLICDDVVDVGALHSRVDRYRVAACFDNKRMDLLPPEGRFWSLFTPWHGDDLNARQKKNPTFALFRRPIGPDFQPIWPAKWPRQVSALRQSTGPDTWEVAGTRRPIPVRIWPHFPLSLTWHRHPPSPYAESLVDHTHPPGHHPGHPPGHDPGVPDHPKTFDEVIRRGFPHRHLEALDRANRVRTRAWPEEAPRPLDGTTPAIRENQATMAAEKRAAFQNAVVKLVADGNYAVLIGHHMDMTHNMHGSMGEVGFYRFLGWHRRFLIEFERELQAADALLRPGASDKLAVPYWRWPDPFPGWLEGFLPARDPMSGQSPPPRKNAFPPEKANSLDLDIIVNQFSLQNTGLPGENDYTKFSYGLEGWGRRPNGTGLPAHNHGHAWIGGIMNNTMTSPTDPVFWMHHAEVDRLWEAWRKLNPAPGPILSGPDRVMDPWAESYDDLLNITNLGYGYDSLGL